jgi:hypothetical protein
MPPEYDKRMLPSAQNDLPEIAAASRCISNRVSRQYHRTKRTLENLTAAPFQ